MFFFNFPQFIPLWFFNLHASHCLDTHSVGSSSELLLTHYFCSIGLHPGAHLTKLSFNPLAPGAIENTSDLHFFCDYSHYRSQHPFTAGTLGLAFNLWMIDETGRSEGLKEGERAEEWARMEGSISGIWGHTWEKSADECY